jgi:hypothetical protein
LASDQFTVIESGAGALDFHLDLTAEVKSVLSASKIECRFKAAYYPLSTT